MKKYYLIICIIVALVCKIIKNNSFNNEIVLADNIDIPGDVNSDNKLSTQDYILI